MLSYLCYLFVTNSYTETSIKIDTKKRIRKESEEDLTVVIIGNLKT